MRGRQNNCKTTPCKMFFLVLELNWDFESLEKNYETSMGLVQSSSAPVVEAMDHSGQYTQPYASIVSSSTATTSWPGQTNVQPSFCPASSVSQMEAQLPIWTSAPVLHPNVIGYQTIPMPGSYTQPGLSAGRGGHIPNVSSSVMDIDGSNPAITSRPYMTPTSISKRLPVPPSACSVETTAGRMPRNSSDSQLYLLAAGDSTSRPRAHLPVELQAPNLVAQLKLTKPRQMLIEEKAKRLRIPRNKSAPGLASLDATSQLKKAPQVGGVRAKRLGRIPRNRSDSALASLIRRTEQSSSTPRRDSESGDSPPSMQAASTQPASRQEATPHVSTKRLPGGEETTQPSQLVHDMVTHLMSKGISMQEILNKLTHMASAGSASQAQGIPHQVRNRIM